MGRKDGPASESERDAAEVRRFGSRRRWLPAAVLIAGAGVVTVLVSRGPSAGDSRLRAFPNRGLAAARAAATAPPVSVDDFLGSGACVQCHDGEYDAWSGSTHGRAGGLAGAEVVIAPFDGAPIRFRDGTVIPRVESDGRYVFEVRQEGHALVAYTVDGVVGGGHMLGGGTQGFFTTWADGTLRFLPFDWSRAEGRWFCNTDTRADVGWMPISPEMPLAACGDWPPVRVLGTDARFANCQECHGSQIRLTSTAGGYRTDFTELAVNCESCHGPGRQHVEWAEAGSFPSPAELGLQSLAALDKEESLSVCLRCHGLKDVLREGYLPGMDFDEFYALKFPVLGDDPYLPDGRIGTFGYQAPHLSSACYLDGAMDCVSCHEPHGQGYWDVHRRPLASPLDDGQCTACHASKADAVDGHTFHPPDSEGSACVSCHMPYLQHPEVGEEIRFARSDHTIPVPRPAFDESIGIESACAQCHQDRDARSLQAQVDTWWGELKPHRPAVAALASARLERPSAGDAPGLLLHVGVGDPMGQFQALARFLTEYTVPESGPGNDVLDPLRALAQDPDLDVRALALATLHWLAGDRPDVRRFLVERLEASEGQEALRLRWGAVLGFLGDEARGEGKVDRSRVAYRKALEILPDDPRVLFAEGLLHTRAGDVGRAVAALTRSTELDPSRPLTWVNLGIALANQGDVDGAVRAYERAMSINPSEPLAHFNLGNVRLRQEDLISAEAAYQRAVQADPGFAEAQFSLARVMILRGRPEDALPHARRAVEFKPEWEAAGEMLRSLLGALR